MPEFYIKLGSLYVVLLDENIIEEWGYYDLASNKKYATKFNKESGLSFIWKWEYLKNFGISFNLEKI